MRTNFQSVRLGAQLEAGDGQRLTDQEVIFQPIRIAEGDEESEEAWCDAGDLLVRNDTFDAPLNVYSDLVSQLQNQDAVEDGEEGQGVDINGVEDPATSTSEVAEAFTIQKILAVALTRIEEGFKKLRAREDQR